MALLDTTGQTALAQSAEQPSTLSHTGENANNPTTYAGLQRLAS